MDKVFFNNKKKDNVVAVSLVTGILLLLTLIFSYYNHLKYRERLVKQWQQQLLVTTRITAHNLERHIDQFYKALQSISSVPHIQKRAFLSLRNEHDAGFNYIVNQYEIYKGDVNSIMLLDSNGRILEEYPKPSEEMHHYSSEEYCVHGTKEEKHLKPMEVYVSNVFQNKMDMPAIAISCPVYFQGKFAGIIHWMIDVEKITGRFTDSIQEGSGGHLCLIDNNMIIQASQKRNIIGLNAANLIKTNEDSIDLHYNYLKSKRYKKQTADFFGKMKTMEEGYGLFVDLTRTLYSIGVFHKVDFGDKKWILIICVPFSEIVQPLIKNAVQNFLLGLLISAIILFLAIRFYRIQVQKSNLEMETKYLSELEKEKQKRYSALIEGQEYERTRIARELHDGLGQNMLAIKLKLELLSEKGAEKNDTFEIKKLFLDAINEIKRISYNLQPVSLEELGLETALNNLCNDIADALNIRIDFVGYGVPAKSDPGIETSIFRIAQEALSNIVKHAEATEANVQLLGNEEQLTLIVEDNGKGFDVGNIQSKGKGLNNIRARAMLLNGSAEIVSEKSRGTTIKVKIPLNK